VSFRNSEISEKVLNMPDTVAPRPPRRVLYCLPCVKRLTTSVKEGRRVDPEVMCERDNAGAKCQSCRDDKGNHNCDDIPPEFNRALNILVHLQQQAAIPGDDAAQVRRGERVRDYALKLVLAVQSFEKFTSAAVKKDKDFLVNRRKSYEENMKRYEQGLGSVGLLSKVNQEVDEKLEQKLFLQWKKEKNWWYLRAVWCGQVA